MDSTWKVLPSSTFSLMAEISKAETTPKLGPASVALLAHPPLKFPQGLSPLVEWCEGELLAGLFLSVEVCAKAAVV